MEQMWPAIHLAKEREKEVEQGGGSGKKRGQK